MKKNYLLYFLLCLIAYFPFHGYGQNLKRFVNKINAKQLEAYSENIPNEFKNIYDKNFTFLQLNNFSLYENMDNMIFKKNTTVFTLCSKDDDSGKLKGRMWDESKSIDFQEEDDGKIKIVNTNFSIYTESIMKCFEINDSIINNRSYRQSTINGGNYLLFISTNISKKKIQTNVVAVYEFDVNENYIFLKENKETNYKPRIFIKD